MGRRLVDVIATEMPVPCLCGYDTPHPIVLEAINVCSCSDENLLAA